MVSVKQRKYNASLTIEAAYITFFAILIIVAVMMVSFFIHDRAVMKADASYLGDLTLRCSLKWINADAKKVDLSSEYAHIVNENWSQAYGAQVGKIQSVGKSMIQEKMIYTRIESCSISCNYSGLLKRLTCSVVIDGRLNFPLNVFGINNFQVHENCEMSEYDAIRFLWMKDMITGE